MKSLLVIIASSVFGLCGVLRAESSMSKTLESQRAEAPKLAELIRRSQQVEALSIDPIGPLKPGEKDGFERLYGYKILGRAVIRDSRQTVELANSLQTAIEQSGGNIAFCFSPHHALRCKSLRGSITVIICFHCLFVEIEGYDRLKGATITSTEEDIWNRVFSALGIMHTSGPNKALEPTATGVTPAADAPVAPPFAVAHH